MPDGARPTATPARLACWLVELARVAPGLVEAHLPLAGLDPRTRERLILTVTEANDCRWLTWVHESWQGFHGEPADADAVEALVAYARLCAETGEPVDATTLEASFAASVVRSARATVARAQLGSLIGNTATSLLGRPPASRSALGLAGDLVTVGMTLPVAVPVAAASAAVATALRVVNRLTPPMPAPRLPADGEANLVVHLLAEAMPVYLGNAVVRTLLVWSPVTLAVGVRLEGTDATLRIGQGRVEIVSGVRSDALTVIEGGVEPLLHVAAGSILRQLANGPEASRT